MFLNSILLEEGFNTCGKDATLFAAMLQPTKRVKVMVDGIRRWVDIPADAEIQQERDEA
jgi:hypothetical protein